MPYNLIPISDASDPRVSDYTNLSDRVAIKQFDRFIAEGDVVVRHLVESPYQVRSVFVADYWMGRAEDVLSGLNDDVPVYVAPESVLDSVVGFKFHRGMLACGQTGTLPPLSSVLQNARTIILLEDLANHDNVGSIFRTTSALGGAGAAVVLNRGSCHPMYRKSVRVSMGHVLRIPFTIVEHIGETLQSLKNAGFVTLAMTPAPDAVDLHALPLQGSPKFALILGAEGPGLSPATMKAADWRVRIPIAHHADSLNVGVAAGIGLYELGVRRTPAM